MNRNHERLHRQGTCARIVSCFFCLACLCSATLAQQSGLVVQVQKVRNNKGNVMVSVYRSDVGFPSEPAKALKTVSVAAQAPTTTVEVDVPAGTYAVSALHDEDGDGTTATNFLGIPKEGVGASNNAKGRMGPPKFEAASFKHPGGRFTIQFQLGY